MSGCRATDELVELHRQIDQAGRDREPFRPRSRAPQAVSFDSPHERVRESARRQHPEPSVRHSAGRFQEDARVVSRGVEMKVSDDGLGHVLDVAMHQGEQAQPDEHHDEALGPLESGHRSQPGAPRFGHGRAILRSSTRDAAAVRPRRARLSLGTRRARLRCSRRRRRSSASAWCQARRSCASERLDELEAALDRRERQLELAAAVLVVHRQLAPAFHLAGLARLRPQRRRRARTRPPAWRARPAAAAPARARHPGRPRARARYAASLRA